MYVYTCVWMHVYTHLHICASRSQKLTSLGVFPKALGHYALRQGSNELDNLASLLWESQSLTHRYRDDKGLQHLPGFYVDSRDLHLGPHTCPESVLSTEPPIQSKSQTVLTHHRFFFLHGKANGSYEIHSDRHSSHYSTKIRLLNLCVCGHV